MRSQTASNKPGAYALTHKGREFTIAKQLNEGLFHFSITCDYLRCSYELGVAHRRSIGVSGFRHPVVHYLFAWFLFCQGGVNFVVDT